LVQQCSNLTGGSTHGNQKGKPQEVGPEDIEQEVFQQER
jgi:hypothetical protein